MAPRSQIIAKLNQIKLECASICLGNRNVREDLVATVTSFGSSYSRGRLIVDLARRYGLDPRHAKTLIVGAAGGRDWTWLRAHGYEVDMLDLGHHPWSAVTAVGDATEPNTWRTLKAKYDLIVLCDVVEHMPGDFEFFKACRERLAIGGCVVVSVPFAHDPEPTHVRAYTLKTLSRLLAHAGFVVCEKFHRPGPLEAFPNLVNAINYGSAVLVWSVRPAGRLLAFLLRFDYWLNEVLRYRIFSYLDPNQRGVTLWLRAGETKSPSAAEINRIAFIPK